jgi:Carboxypeptidase regulatory-like domain
MTRDRDVTLSRDRTQRDFLLRELEHRMLFLVRTLILVWASAIPTLCADSLQATPITNWAGHLERLGELGWNGGSLAFGTLTQSQEEERINLTVVVTDAETGQPVNQARLTLEFTEPGDPSKLRRSQKLSYSAKTNAQGHYKFPSLPKGTIRLIVTADRHQSFSKEFELEKENQVIEVKLKKPQPLL